MLSIKIAKIQSLTKGYKMRYTNKDINADIRIPNIQLYVKNLSCNYHSANLLSFIFLNNSTIKTCCQQKIKRLT